MPSPDKACPDSIVLIQPAVQDEGCLRMRKPDQLAESLFIKFQQDFPLADGKGSGRKIKPLPNKNIEQRLDQFYQAAREARKEHRLWVIGWARAVSKLQKRLLVAGYPPELVSKLLLAMMINSQKAD